MRKSRYTDEQIIVFIKQADAGMSVAELCRREGLSSATFYKWRAKFGGMEASCRVPDDWLLHNRRALLIGREVLRGLLAEFAGRAPTC